MPSWAVFYLCSLPRTESDNAATNAKPAAKSEEINTNKINNKQQAAKTEQKSR